MLCQFHHRFSKAFPAAISRGGIFLSGFNPLNEFWKMRDFVP
jgi:hypothetical protein